MRGNIRAKHAIVRIPHPEKLDNVELQEQVAYDFHDLSVTDTSTPNVVKLTFADGIRIQALKKVTNNPGAGFAPNPLFRRRVVFPTRLCRIPIPTSIINEIDIKGVVTFVSNKELLFRIQL